MRAWYGVAEVPMLPKFFLAPQAAHNFGRTGSFAFRGLAGWDRSEFGLWLVGLNALSLEADGVENPAEKCQPHEVIDQELLVQRHRVDIDAVTEPPLRRNGQQHARPSRQNSQQAAGDPGGIAPGPGAVDQNRHDER